MKRRILMVSTTMALTLASCGKANDRGDRGNSSVATAPVTSSAAASDAPPFDTQLPMKEFMVHVMQHAGDGVWKWQGLELDKTGEHSLYPKNDADWEDAESGALSLVEATNLLLIPGRRIAEPGWDKAVIDVRTVAKDAVKAAEQHDKVAFLAAGSALDAACDGCHVRYDPTFKTAPK